MQKIFLPVTTNKLVLQNEVAEHGDFLLKSFGSFDNNSGKLSFTPSNSPSSMREKYKSRFWDDKIEKTDNKKIILFIWAF